MSTTAATTRLATSPAPSPAPQGVAFLSEETVSRVKNAAALLRISPDALVQRLLTRYYNALGGLPTDLILYIFLFLDYSTIASVVMAVSKQWADVLARDPGNQASGMRQVHGVHLLDPVRGIFYFPRALKRVQMSPEGPASGGNSSSKPLENLGHGATRQSAFSFLTVDVRTQDVRSLPWASVKHIVRQAVEEEKMTYGIIRSPSLQKSEGPVLMQSAMVTSDRLVYLFGGQTYEGIVVNRCFCYLPQNKRWRALPPLRQKRASATAAVLRGKVYVFGGYGENEEVLDTYEVFDLRSGTWDRPPALAFLPRQDSLADPTTPLTSVTPSFAMSASHSDAAQGLGASEHSRGHPGVAGEESNTAVDPGPFRMPSKLCGTAVVPYEDVLIFVGGYRDYIEPTDTAVQYSSVSSFLSTPIHPSSGVRHPRLVPSMSTSSMEAAAALAEVADHLSRHPRTATAAAMQSNAFLTAATPPPQHTAAAPAAEAAAAADVVLEDPNLMTTPAAEDGSQPAPLLPLPRRPSLTIDGPPCAERSVWVFSPRLQKWWLHGPALPSGRAFGSAVVLTFPGSLGTCLCYFGGCASADEPETAMLYIPLNAHRGGHADKASTAAPVASTRAASSCSEGGTPRGDTYVLPGSDEVMRTYFRDPHRLLWHRHLRIPLGGAFCSATTIGKASARSVVLSAFYPTPNIGFCHVSKLLPMETCGRPEWRPSVTCDSHPPPIDNQDENNGDEEDTEGDEESGSSVDEGSHATQMRLSPALLQARQRASTASGSAFSVVATPVRRDQRREVQQLLRTAVDAASQHRPRTPQSVGEDHQWHLAPLSEVKVRDDETGRPLMNRVSWRIQALNAKPIVSIE